MSEPGGPSPDVDPYFVAKGLDSIKGAKWAPPGELDVRRDLLSTEAAFRVAGTTGMILGALIFVVFGVAVSAMLRDAGEPDGVLVGPEWLFRRWVVRETTDLTMAVVAVAACWGLRRLRPWARRFLIGLSVVPPLALLVCLGFRAWGAAPAAIYDFWDDLAKLCVLVFPAGAAVLWATCCRRGRTVFGPSYAEMIARTPKLRPGPATGLRAGLGLTCAMSILYWMSMILVLGTLAVCGVIRSI